MDTSIRFYVDGLNFKITRRWVVDGKLRWCWLQLDSAAIMLQERFREGHDAWVPSSKVGEGISIYFICQDALAIYHQLTCRGIPTSLPFVGNGMWVTSITDPDGYNLHFESATSVPEGTLYHSP